MDGSSMSEFCAIDFHMPEYGIYMHNRCRQVVCYGKEMLVSLQVIPSSLRHLEDQCPMPCC